MFVHFVTLESQIWKSFLWCALITLGTKHIMGGRTESEGYEKGSEIPSTPNPIKNGISLLSFL